MAKFKPSDFSIQINKDCENLNKRVVGEVFSGVIVSTPVDTGQARSNWRIGVSSIDSSVTTGSNPQNQNSQMSKIKNSKLLGKLTYISNSLPYIERLNNGYSPQADPHYVEAVVAAVAEKYK